MGDGVGLTAASASNHIGASTPALSVTVLNYNYGRYLRQCIESILEQTYKDFELIVIDDSSNDDSLSVIHSYLGDARVRVIAHDVNQGFVKSLVEGTEVHSRGKILTVISADDVVRRSDAFECQMALFDATPDLALCFSSYDRFHDRSGHTFDTYRYSECDAVLDRRQAFMEILAGKAGRMIHSGTFIRASAYYAAGGYRRDIHYAVDSALWPLLALQGPVAYFSQVLYGYRIHPDQMTLSFAKGRAFTREFLSAIGAACEAAEGQGIPTVQLRRKAIQYNLGIMAADDAFSHRPALALSRCLSALSLCPFQMLSVRSFWAALLRVALGERSYGRLRSLVNPGRARIPRHVRE